MTDENEVDHEAAIAVPRYQDSDQFLAVKRAEDREVAPGLWESPAGKIKEDETPEEAAVRELKEETGLEGELKGVGEFHERTVGDESVRLYPYLIEVDFKDEVELSSEHSEYKWVTKEEAKELYRQDNFDRVLNSIKEIQGDVAIAVTRENREYLILRRSKHESFSGKWEFAGGEVEDETISRAALRELKEETGLEAEIIAEGSPYIGEGSTGYWKLCPFLMELMPSNQEIKLSEEHDEYKWIKLDEIGKLETMGHKKGLKTLGLI